MHVVQVVAEELKTDDLSERRNDLVAEPVRLSGHRVPELVVITSPYQEFFGPLIRYIQKLSVLHRDRPIAVIVPELVEKKWYNFLFRHRATVLKELLLVHGGPQIIIVNTPLYLGKMDKFEG